MVNRRKVGMTSSPHGPYVQGYTSATMCTTQSRDNSRWHSSQKAGLSSEWILQLDSMKMERLVFSDMPVARNTFPGRVHTPRHTPWVEWSRRACANTEGRQRPKEWSVTGVKS